MKVSCGYQYVSASLRFNLESKLQVRMGVGALVCEAWGVKCESDFECVLGGR